MQPHQKTFTIAGGAVIAILLFFIFFPLRYIVVPVGFKGVVVDAPYIFGKDQVRKEVASPGRYLEWKTTTIKLVASTPIRQDVFLDDLTTSDNNRVDYNAAITFTIEDPVDVIENWTMEFWSKNVNAEFISMVRAKVKPYTLNILMGTPDVAEKLDKEITAELIKFIADRGLKIKIHGVALGQARPNREVGLQIEETARLDEVNRTLDKRISNEDKRKNEEKARALADKAYRIEMGLSVQEYQQLRLATIQAEACKQAKQCFIGIERIVNSN